MLSWVCLLFMNPYLFTKALQFPFFLVVYGDLLELAGRGLATGWGPLGRREKKSCGSLWSTGVSLLG